MPAGSSLQLNTRRQHHLVGLNNRLTITRKKGHPRTLCPRDRMGVSKATATIFQIWLKEERHFSGFFVS
ncbi:unannotated protein [freshwater metagenome]|uniref:Unannotated protein n=1 Tax=freshwater metagenome TaxID=449393 RepID=A0A6J6HUX2_9ZZZZ